MQTIICRWLLHVTHRHCSMLAEQGPPVEHIAHRLCLECAPLQRHAGNEVQRICTLDDRSTDGG